MAGRMPHVGPLRPELVALLEHIELNNAGWWERAVERVMLGVIWASDQLSSDELATNLLQQYGLEVPVPEVEQSLEKLLADDVLISTGKQIYKLSEASRRDFEQWLKEDERVFDAAELKFKKLTRAACPGVDLDHAWQSFTRDLVEPLVRQLGARTFDFITGRKTTLLPNVQFDQYLKQFRTEDRPAARRAAVSFLSPDDSDVRSFVLKYLSSYFLLRSASLDAKTLEGIARITARKPTFKVLLDSNLCFSLLGLHNNPSNEASAALMSLVEQLKGTVDITLHVLPRTLREAKASLVKERTMLSGVVLTKNLANGASEATLSGIAAKFLEVVRETGRAQTAEEYFNPYIDNLLKLLRDHGVELLNQDTSDLAANQQVVDDILSHVAFEEKTRGKRAKTYELVEHDMILWHVVGGRRSKWVESPLEAIWWIATVDYRFLGFDAYKAEHKQQLPICLHPVALVQMLQFWVPRSPQMEQALMSNLSLPVFFRDFDPDTERVTIAILRALSRFEESEKLSEETISSMLLNGELRQRMILERDKDRQIQLVRDAILEEDARVRSELEAANKSVEQLRDARRADGEQISELRKVLAEGTGRAAALSEELASYKREMEEFKAQVEVDKAQLERTRFNALVALPALVLSVVVGSALGWGLIQSGMLGPFWAFLLSFGAVTLVAEEGLYRQASRIPEVSGTGFWHHAGRWRRRLGSAVSAVVLSVVGDAVWEWLRGGLG